VGTRAKLWIDVALLCAIFPTFVSGLVLLLAFHVGDGRFQSEAFGLSRLVWQNIHRLGAIAAAVALVLHASASARPIVTRIIRTLRGRAARHDASEFVFYAAIMTVCLTGFSVWLVIGGSMSLFGPVRLGPIAHERHRWIDVHNITALLSLYLTTSHVRRRWRALKAFARRSGSPSATGSTAAKACAPVEACREREITCDSICPSTITTRRPSSRSTGKHAKPVDAA
jgi:hypothetical protein